MSAARRPARKRAFGKMQRSPALAGSSQAPHPHKKPRTWTARARALAEAIPFSALNASVRDWAQRNRENDSWHVGFSGGADSLATLLLVYAHWTGKRKKLSALHFNHRLRGAAAHRDEIFCRNVCRALGVKFSAARWDTAPPQPSEAEARKARQEFFASNSRVLWLGHQQDDVAESLLMRLARGSGAAGLSAPRPVQQMPGKRVHLRPLLDLRKSRILSALRALGIPWREDDSNATPRYFRNRVRHHVVDAWADAAQRDAVAGAALTRELLEEDDVALDELARNGKFLRGRQLDLAKLRGQPRAIVRRTLYRWLQRQQPAPSLSRQAFAALLEAVERGKPTRQSLSATQFAEIRENRLLVTIAPQGRFNGK